MEVERIGTSTISVSFSLCFLNCRYHISTTFIKLYTRSILTPLNGQHRCIIYWSLFVDPFTCNRFIKSGKKGKSKGFATQVSVKYNCRTSLQRISLGKFRFSLKSFRLTTTAENA